MPEVYKAPALASIGIAHIHITKMSRTTEIQAQTFTLNTGAEIPAIGLGTYKSKPNEVEDAVYAALKAGYKHIDEAYKYQNEAEAGSAIKRYIEETGTPRKDLFITSKLWNTFHSRPEEALDKSLELLGLDYVDLYLMHYPVPLAPGINDDAYPKRDDGSMIFQQNWSTRDTWHLMEKLLKTGKAKAIGVSNFSTVDLEFLLSSPGLQVVPAVNQVELHPYLIQEKLKEYCDEKGILLTGYSPLGSSASTLHEEEVIKEIADKHGKTSAQIMLSWGIAKGWAVVPKSVTPSRIASNLQVFSLPAEDMESIDELGREQKQRFMDVGRQWQVEMFHDDASWVSTPSRRNSRAPSRQNSTNNSGTATPADLSATAKSQPTLPPQAE